MSTIDDDCVARIDIRLVFLEPVSADTRLKAHSSEFRRHLVKLTGVAVDSRVGRLCERACYFFHDVARDVGSAFEGDCSNRGKAERPEGLKGGGAVELLARRRLAVGSLIEEVHAEETGVIVRSFELLAVFTAHVETRAWLRFAQAFHEELEVPVDQAPCWGEVFVAVGQSHEHV